MHGKPRLKGLIVLFFGLTAWAVVSIIGGTWCWVQGTFGVPCPGCGSTRAALALLQGNFREALTWHPLIILSLILLPYVAVRSLWIKRKPFTKAEKSVILISTVIFMVVYAVRMILFFPHTYPMDINDMAIFRQSLRLLGVIY
ncbi:MAG: DUF2752 domain-containing protein [Defluviitaleaceae bacterium]|nr:DUF2752 domain-containing protein [Defluviitaleaceae bacterium]